MGHGQGPGAARGGPQRKRRHRREDSGPEGEKEWPSRKVGSRPVILTLFLFIARVSAVLALRRDKGS